MRIPENHWLRNATIAHRGLHNETMPENSMTAFKAAMDAGFPIEIDVHLTRDDKVVVFHDHSTLRVCGVDILIERSTYEELQNLTLSGTDQKIPLLSELLEVATTPILVELKTLEKTVGKLEKATVEIMKGSKVEYAIQSFNPFSIIWLANNAPTVLRGQLSSYFAIKNVSLKQYMLRAMLLNRMAKPDFISYEENYLPNKYVTKYCAKHPQTAKLAWTVRSQVRQNVLLDFVDSVIFENYLPTEITR